MEPEVKPLSRIDRIKRFVEPLSAMTKNFIAGGIHTPEETPTTYGEAFKQGFQTRTSNLNTQFRPPKISDYREGNIDAVMENALNFSPGAMAGSIKRTAKIAEFAKKVKSQLPLEVEDAVVKALNSIDTTMPTVKGAPYMNGFNDVDFRLMQLQDKVKNKPLSKSEVLEVNDLLKKRGIDVEKEMTQWNKVNNK